MKERPILMSTPMVVATIEGRKRQTRRIIKQKHIKYIDEKQGFREPCNAEICPYGIVGDHLWVRETFAECITWIAPEDPRCGGNPNLRKSDPFYIYRASDEKPEHMPWKPSIFMPRAASRISMEITNIRVERLQDISPLDATDEGIVPYKDFRGRTIGYCPQEGDGWFQDPVECYRALWQNINGRGSWAENPWLWVIDFLPIIDWSKCS